MIPLYAVDNGKYMMSDKFIRYKERNHDDPFDYGLDDVILRRDAMEALENEENLHGAMDSVRDGAFRRTKRAAVRVVAGVPAVADVKPVVLCKDCKYSYADIGGLTCSHGVCVDSIVADNFYCADGERSEDNNAEI